MVWTKDEKPKTAGEQQIEVWSGRADELTSVSYEAEKFRVQLEPRKDSTGRWYAVTLDKTVDVPPAGADAGAPPSSIAMSPAAGDGGAKGTAARPSRRRSARPSASSPPRRAKRSPICWRR